jgi:1-phosphatidylinositol-3-phosphate 5-kinase
MEAMKVPFYDLVEKFSVWVPRKRAKMPAMSREFWMPYQSCRVCCECITPSAYSIYGTIATSGALCSVGNVHNTHCPLLQMELQEWQGCERVQACNFCFKLKQAEQRKVV